MPFRDDDSGENFVRPHYKNERTYHRGRALQAKKKQQEQQQQQPSSLLLLFFLSLDSLSSLFLKFEM